MGLLSTGIYVAFGVVLPYLLIFYVVLGFLEDCGYLPRLAVMVDRILHRIGLHGYAIIPTVLGFGCNVPAVLAARNLESRRERFIALTLTAVAVPCISQNAMIFGLVGRYGGAYLSVVYATLFFIWVVLGLILDRSLSGYTPPWWWRSLLTACPNSKPRPKSWGCASATSSFTPRPISLEASSL